MCMCMCVCVCVFVCACVCERESERERERECVCVCIWVREKECVHVCVCVLVHKLFLALLTEKYRKCTRARCLQCESKVTAAALQLRLASSHKTHATAYPMGCQTMQGMPLYASHSSLTLWNMPTMKTSTLFGSPCFRMMSHWKWFLEISLR